MTRQLFRNNQSTAIPVILPEKLGGTGAGNRNELIAKLSAIRNSVKGASRGLVPLDANGKIPKEFFPPLPSGSGIKIVYNPVVNIFGSDPEPFAVPIIHTNPDIVDTQFTFSAERGRVELRELYGDMVLFYIPPAFSCVDYFTINGKTYSIQVNVDAGGGPPPA